MFGIVEEMEAVQEASVSRVLVRPERGILHWMNCNAARGIPLRTMKTRTRKTYWRLRIQDVQNELQRRLSAKIMKPSRQRQHRQPEGVRSLLQLQNLALGLMRPAHLFLLRNQKDQGI